MTKHEAIARMLAGEKVTHRYFSDGEYMEMHPIGSFLLSGQFYITTNAFWADRSGPGWNNDWEIYKGEAVEGPAIETTIQVTVITKAKSDPPIQFKDRSVFALWLLGKMEQAGVSYVISLTKQDSGQYTLLIR